MGKIDISIEIEQYVKMIEKGIKKESEKITKRVASKGASDLRKTAPKDTGVYRNSFRVKKEGETFYIYNTRKWSLVHLLEYGHITRDGKSRAKSIPHVYPKKDELYEILEREMISLINNFS